MFKLFILIQKKYVKYVISHIINLMNKEVYSLTKTLDQFRPLGNL